MRLIPVAALVASLLSASIVSAAPFSTANAFGTIYKFTGGADGTTPVSGLTLGPKSALYGATQNTVFQLKQNSKGVWSETPISTSVKSLVGTSTVLYGVVGLGAGKTCKPFDQGCGEVVELTPPVTGSTWTRKTLYEFKGGKDGAIPVGIAIAANGDIVGTTSAGGGSSTCGSDNNINNGCGTLFQLTKGKSGWTEKILHRFKGGKDGATPLSAPSFDAAGNIYGTTDQGGATASKSADGNGTTPLGNNSAAKLAGGNPAFSCEGGGTVYVFDKTAAFALDLWYGLCELQGPAFANSIVTTLLNGILNTQVSAPSAFANSPATAKAANGAIFTTEGGGHASECTNLGNNGCGVVAELTAPANGKTPWQLKTLHAFSSDQGALPYGNLVSDGKDALYGVTGFGGIDTSACQKVTGGTNGCGAIYKLVKSSGDWAWNGTVYKFAGGTRGAQPNGQLVLFKGKIYGTTANGGEIGGPCGNFGCGTVFSLTP
jgi:uncharacterized protein YceK